jgi:hypothetical protein
VAEHRSWYAFCCIHTALNIDIDVQIHLWPCRIERWTINTSMWFFFTNPCNRVTCDFIKFSNKLILQRNQPFKATRNVRVKKDYFVTIKIYHNNNFGVHYVLYEISWWNNILNGDTIFFG